MLDITKQLAEYAELKLYTDKGELWRGPGSYVKFFGHPTMILWDTSGPSILFFNFETRLPMYKHAIPETFEMDSVIEEAAYIFAHGRGRNFDEDPEGLDK